MKAFTAVVLLLFGITANTSFAKPNVVIFLTDDQGWGDLSIHGNTNLETPNIDSLGKEGAMLQNFYVCAVCAPTRAEFLTGRYHPKTGVTGVSRGEGRLNVDETTIANVFRKNGYTTGAFGKWHNGTQSPYHPNDRGFDEFYGFTSGHWGAYYSPPLDHNKTKIKGNGYVVDDFTDRAIQFIEKNREKPFFCYVPYNTPHSPMIIGDRWFEKFADREPSMKFHDPKREDPQMTRAALAMVENIDWNIGRILETLKKHDLEEDTIILFFSDNGPNSFRWNGGMKGKKGNLDEGGLRSPLLVRWPAEISAGHQVEPVCAAIDLLPTLAELAELPMETNQPVDGRSFAKLLTGKETNLPDRELFSMWRNKVTVRTAKYRLDQQGKLFDIAADRGQTKEVSDQFPEIAERLRKSAAEFSTAMKPHIEASAGRPFTVGYDRSTTLPARDGVEDGPSISRSAKAPNNSFFENWKSPDDSISYQVDVKAAGEFAATVFYTCRKEDVGATIRLAQREGDHCEAIVTEAFDPPFYDNSKERMENSHYIVKDFRPLPMGTIRLEKGHQTLLLSAPKIAGEEAIDFHSLELIKQ